MWLRSVDCQLFRHTLLYMVYLILHSRLLTKCVSNGSHVRPSVGSIISKRILSSHWSRQRVLRTEQETGKASFPLLSHSIPIRIGCLEESRRTGLPAPQDDSPRIRYAGSRVDARTSPGCSTPAAMDPGNTPWRCVPWTVGLLPQ